MCHLPAAARAGRRAVRLEHHEAEAGQAARRRAERPAQHTDGGQGGGQHIELQPGHARLQPGHIWLQPSVRVGLQPLPHTSSRRSHQAEGKGEGSAADAAASAALIDVSGVVAVSSVMSVLGCMMLQAGDRIHKFAESDSLQKDLAASHVTYAAAVDKLVSSLAAVLDELRRLQPYLCIEPEAVPPRAVRPGCSPLLFSARREDLHTAPAQARQGVRRRLLRPPRRLCRAAAERRRHPSRGAAG